MLPLLMVSSSTHHSCIVQKITIVSEYAGQRVDNFLLNRLKGVPKTRVYRMIRKGEVRVNRGRVKPDYKLMQDDLLRIPPVRSEEPPPLLSLSWNTKTAHHLLEQILFEDEGLIILNKPAGIAVHGGSGISFGVIEALRYLRGPHCALELVHRLDRDTSGCLMIAKRRTILKAIHTQLQAGLVEKIYCALVKGAWQGGTTVSAPLKKNYLLSGERVVRVSQLGQESLTEFKVLKRYRTATLIEARPKTGRTHQIRVHAASVGHPLASDPKYGDPQFNQEMKHKGINRLFLHAQKIGLASLPGYSSDIMVEAPLDPKLQAALARLAEKG